MGKRFKGKSCAYCGQTGHTADHVFAKQFFPEDLRANLPQVCACSTCNREKSQLEHYLSVLLPFGGQHPRSKEILTRMIPKRLRKNHKLHSQLAAEWQDRAPVDGSGLHPSMTLPFEVDKLERFLGFIARGLANFHFGVLVPRSYFSSGRLLTHEGDQIYCQLFRQFCKNYARGDLGDGLIRYEGMQDSGDPGATLWRFNIYEGVKLGGDPDLPDFVGSTLWALTALAPMPGFDDSQLPALDSTQTSG